MPYKIDKKVIIAFVIILVLVILAGFVLSKQFSDNSENIQNSAGGASTESLGDSDSQINLGEIEVETKGSFSSGGLTVCVDRCGDNVCQTEDEACLEGDLNCICLETSEECPQDCLPSGDVP